MNSVFFTVLLALYSCKTVDTDQKPTETTDNATNADSSAQKEELDLMVYLQTAEWETQDSGGLVFPGFGHDDILFSDNGDDCVTWRLKANPRNESAKQFFNLSVESSSKDSKTGEIDSKFCNFDVSKDYTVILKSKVSARTAQMHSFPAKGGITLQNWWRVSTGNLSCPGLDPYTLAKGHCLTWESVAPYSIYSRYNAEIISPSGEVKTSNTPGYSYTCDLGSGEYKMVLTSKLDPTETFVSKISLDSNGSPAACQTLSYCNPTASGPTINARLFYKVGALTNSDSSKLSEKDKTCTILKTDWDKAIVQGLSCKITKIDDSTYDCDFSASMANCVKACNHSATLESYCKKCYEVEPDPARGQAMFRDEGHNFPLSPADYQH